MTSGLCWGTDLGKASTNSAALKVPKSTVASIVLKWKKFVTPRTLPGAGCLDKLSNQRRRALGGELTKNPVVTLAELQRSCVDGEETLRRTTITATLYRSRLYDRVARHKPLQYSDCEKQDSLTWAQLNKPTDGPYPTWQSLRRSAEKNGRKSPNPWVLILLMGNAAPGNTLSLLCIT